MIDLTASEVRVLGSLMEKETTTPDNYPLTVNSLVLACNQSTNRHPIVAYSETDVTATLTSMRERGLTRIVYSQSNRAPKHRHVASEVLRLEPEEQAVVCVLLLRGPQTLGELKTRTERMHAFADLEAVEQVLDRLAGRDDPLVVHLPRRPGQKDARYAHLLSGPVAESAGDDDGASSSVARLDRIGALDARVAHLEHKLSELATVVDELRSLLD